MNNNTNEQSTFPFRLDSRPMDRGEFQQWGYGYSRLVKVIAIIPAEDEVAQQQ